MSLINQQPHVGDRQKLWRKFRREFNASVKRQAIFPQERDFIKEQTAIVAAYHGPKMATMFKLSGGNVRLWETQHD